MLSVLVTATGDPITDTVISGPLVLAALLALAAGVVSFASPCVVPLVPGYVSYLAGLVGISAAPVRRTRTIGAAALFVTGFSVVFIAESALVLGIYRTLIANQTLLLRVSGIITIVMAALLLLPGLQREWRPALARFDGTRRARIWGAPVLGAAFGTGWLACTSPTLAGIVALSATEWNGNAVRGLVLVALYCVGLGVPFVLLAAGLSWAEGALAFVRRHTRGIQVGGAVALGVIGIAMLTGLWGYLLAPLQGLALVL